jgi:hypothetical protein
MLQPGANGFAEDKDEARRIRIERILPTLGEDRGVVLDFGQVKYSTQSFVHALVGEAMQRYGEAALHRIEFKSCSPQVKSLVQLVVDYSLGGFRTDQGKSPSDKPRGTQPRTAANGKSIPA